MELQAIIGQLFVVDGSVQEATAVPGLLGQPAPSRVARGRERDFLFVHLSLSGSPDENADLYQQLTAELSARYYQNSGSITSALRRAVQQTNRQLLERNVNARGPARQGAITCAVLRGGELYIVQAGESLALLGHNFGIERIPQRDPDRITPLGQTAGLDFRFFHQRLQSGDMLLLADPRIAHLPGHALAPALVDTEVELGIAELRDIVGEDSARLLLVEFSSDAPADVAAVVPTAVQGGRITLGSQTARRAAPPPPPSPEPATQIAPATAASQAGRRLDTAELADSVETTARRAAAGSAMGLSRFTGWLADMLARLRGPETTRSEPRSLIVPAIMAIVIPIVVAVIVSGVYLQRGRVRRVAEIRQQMAEAISLADEAGSDVTAARTQYNRLLELADEADTLRPGDEGISNMREQALLALDEIDNVTRLTAVPLYSYGEEAAPVDVVLQDGFDGGIYVLDEPESTVYLHPTDELYTELTTAEPSVLVTARQGIGNHVVGRIIDLMWRPRGLQVSRDGLSMLDTRGALITYFPNFADTRAVPLGLSSEWVNPVALAQFGERLYVLDPGAATIWRYLPDGDGFIVDEESRQLDLGPESALATAVDFDIYSEDGSVVVAYSDGKLRYFDSRSGRVQWDETDLLANGLTTPLVSPTAVTLVGRGLNASIFALDAGSGRVIQISRGGTVLTQYRATDADGRDQFSRATGMDIAETPLRVFITVDDSLYVATQ